MFKNSFFRTISFFLLMSLFYSCDREVSMVGEDLIGENSFSIVKAEYPVVSYNQKLGPIQSNNLEVNPLGVYDNPAFGKTNASFVTQLTLGTEGLSFAASAKIKSVVLSIPYFVDASQTVRKEDGSSTYVLDSIYGPDKAKMKLKVYESGYYLRNLDPESQFAEAQKYYSNQFTDFDQLKIGTPLNDAALVSENSEFFFDAAEQVTTSIVDGKETVTRNGPAMKLNLSAAFFTQKIIKAPASSLATNDAFKDYFRGLFFTVEEGASPGNMAMINFKGGSITIKYSETTDTTETEKTLVLSLSGNTVSLLNQSNTNSAYTDATNPANIDQLNGDANLYLKGGEGSMSVIKLFGEDKFGADGISGVPNGVADQLDIIRKNKYLINEADLTFNLNTDAMGSGYIPQRVYLYDFKNNQVLVDYRETSTVSSNTKNNKYVFGGIYFKNSAGGGSYKFRITNHIRNLVKYADSTNVNIGLVVTEDINKSAFYALRDKAASPNKAPMASVMNPLGAVVFGNKLAPGDKNYDKRLKFEIYYTKTE